MLLLVTMETSLHLLRIDAFNDSVTSLPPGITIGANSFTGLHVFSAKATLMVECTPVARILDAAIIFPVLGEFSLCIDKEGLGLVDFLVGGRTL